MGIIQNTGNFIKNLFSKQELDSVNKEYNKFEELTDENEHGIINKIINDSGNDATEITFQSVNAYKSYIYGDISNQKIVRLNFFRQMANYPEVSDIVGEICDECINYDDNGNIINLLFSKGVTLNSDRKDEVMKEFEYFISLFNIENDGWLHFRDLIRDGEVVWENIINEKNSEELGIINVHRILPECFEYMVDLKHEIFGIVLNARLLLDEEAAEGGVDVQSTINNNSQRGLNKSGWHNVGMYNNNKVSHKYQQNNTCNAIPLSINQITLVNSGEYNSDKSIIYPILESSRKTYRQLQLIEDSIIIYRLVRAPERLLFNVSTGKARGPKANTILNKAMRRFQTKKVYDPQSGGVTQDYDPHQMQENFWFAKPDGSEGTTIETIGGGSSLGEIEDLIYFQKKLYRSLKAPWASYEEPTSTVENSDSISREDYKFSKFVMRIQQQYSKGLESAFIVHLKLKGIWKKFNLNKRTFNIKFVPPMTFDIYAQQKLLNIKIENYNTVADNESFSKDLAAMKYLNWSGKDIKENAEYLEKEALRQAYIERKISNIEDHGTPSEDTAGDDEF